MTKEAFITFITNLGFCESWSSVNKNRFYLTTDKSILNNFSQKECNQLTIQIQNDMRFELSITDYTNNTVGSFGIFTLNKFSEKNDDQIQLFMSFLSNSFEDVPEKIYNFIEEYL